MKIILAGVASIFGLRDISTFFYNYNVELVMVETEYMSRFISEDELKFVQIQEKIEYEEGIIVIPLNEYWVSFIIKNPYMARISDKALRSSRSKIFLAELLTLNGIDHCEFYEETDIEKFILERGRKIIIKPDSLYSGHGVKIISALNIDQYHTYIEDAKQIKRNAQHILNIDSTLVTFCEYIEGTEYSVDVFWHVNKCHIVRACRKYLETIKDAPCVTAYVIEQLNKDVLRKIEIWTSLLFDQGDVSFAQFDFIIDKSGQRIVPIDFSCRVGGGMLELFQKKKGNVYLECLKNIVFKNGNVLLTKLQGCYQFHFIPVVTGIVKDDNYYSINQVIKYKHKSDRVESVDPSANNRLAILLGDVFSIDEYLRIKKYLLVGEKNILREENG